MHNVRVGDRMVELAALQLVQLGVRSVTRGSTNQEVEGPPPQVFPQTMLSVKRVKDNI